MTTITIERELLEQALNALLLPCDRWNKHQFKIVTAAANAIRAELAKPEQEESFIPNWANYRQGVADGKAGNPKWHDAPTEPGLWLNSINRRAMLLYKNELAAWSDTGARWFGPICEDAAIAKAEGGAA